MNVDFIIYLKKYFPNTYKKNTIILCNNGWFRLLLWLGRYIDSYIINQNKLSITNPDKFLPVNDFNITNISKENAILKITRSGGNEHLESILNYTEYISGYFCELCGSTKDIYYTNNKTIDKSCNNSLIPDSELYSVDNKELKEIYIKNNFKN